MRLFVSYSRDDAPFVTELVHHLESVGHDVWVDTEDIRGSEQWRASIVAGITNADLVLLVVSPTSMASDNVAREIAVAAEQHRRIIPVVVRAADMTGNAAFEIAGLQQISFEERPFEEAFDQLSGELSALTGSPASPPRRVSSRSSRPKARPRSRRRPLIGAVALAVPLLIVWWLLRDAGGGNTTTAAAPKTTAATATKTTASRSPASVALNAKVWFAGFDIGVQRATYDRDSGEVRIAATFVNRQAATANVVALFIGSITAVEWQGHRARPDCSCGSLPPGATERDELVVDVPTGFQLSGAALVFGGPEQHQAVVPLDGKAPKSERPVGRAASGKIYDGAGTTFSVERVEVVPATCHGRADELGYVPGPAKEMSVVAWGTAVTGKPNVGYGQGLLILPDGTKLASPSLSGYIYVLNADQPEHDIGICFRVPKPVKGQYRLIVTAVNVTPLPSGLSIAL
jgi:hypothetical protein